MKLEDQVTSLEISKKLKELGVKQSSLFFWTAGGVASRSDALPILESNYSAFTVAELGEMLPWCVYWNPLVIKKIENPEDTVIFDVRYENHVRLFSKPASLANAMGELVILLINEPTLWNWKEKWLEVKGDK